MKNWKQKLVEDFNHFKPEQKWFRLEFYSRLCKHFRTKDTMTHKEFEKIASDLSNEMGY